MHKRSNSFDRSINYKQEKFDPELVFLDKETNLLKVLSTWTRSGFRIINGEQKKIYREHKEKGKESSKILREEKVSLKPAERPYLLTERKRSQSKGSEKSRRRSSSKKYEPAEFDPSLVYYDSQKNLLKIPSKTAKNGYRFLTENEEESYKAYKLEEEKKLKLIFSEKKPVKNSLGKESATEKEKGLKKEMLDPFTRFIVNYANKQEKAEKPSIKSRSKMRDEDKDGRQNYQRESQIQSMNSSKVLLKNAYHSERVSIQAKIRQFTERRDSFDSMHSVDLTSIKRFRQCIGLDKQPPPQQIKHDFKKAQKVKYQDDPIYLNKIKDQNVDEQNKPTVQHLITPKKEKIHKEPQSIKTQNFKDNLLTKIANLQTLLQLNAIFLSPIFREENHSAFVRQAIESTLGKRMKRADLICQWRKDNPNFAGTLPTPKFPFLILLRSRKQNNFGIISTGIMPKKKEEKAFLFNSSSKIVFSKLKSCEGLPAATFSSNIWVFGNSEIIIKKQNLSQIQIHFGNILSKKYFDIRSRSDFTGEPQDKIDLTHFQIHSLHLS